MNVTTGKERIPQGKKECQIQLSKNENEIES